MHVLIVVEGCTSHSQMCPKHTCPDDLGVLFDPHMYQDRFNGINAEQLNWQYELL